MGYAFLGRKRFSISEEAGGETGRAWTVPAVSSALSGPFHFALLPRACAAGYILAPLRGFALGPAGSMERRGPGGSREGVLPAPVRNFRLAALDRSVTHLHPSCCARGRTLRAGCPRTAGQRPTLRLAYRLDDDRVGQIARAVMGVVIITCVEASSENGLAKKRRHHIRVGRR